MLREIYEKLLAYYGPQGWWPADDEFEVMVGAILTQNTNWSNVEKAISNLKPGLEPFRLLEMDTRELAEKIKPSGFFNIKAVRLKEFLNWYQKYSFSPEKLKKEDLHKLREELLEIRGIGRETADSILLYALGKPVFVVDAYTRRMFGRLGVSLPDDYDDIRNYFETALNQYSDRVDLYKEYHALIVRHSKVYCRKKPDCANCFLQNTCKRQI